MAGGVVLRGAPQVGHRFGVVAPGAQGVPHGEPPRVGRFFPAVDRALDRVPQVRHQRLQPHRPARLDNLQGLDRDRPLDVRLRLGLFDLSAGERGHQLVHPDRARSRFGNQPQLDQSQQGVLTFLELARRKFFLGGTQR